MSDDTQSREPTIRQVFAEADVSMRIDAAMRVIEERGLPPARACKAVGLNPRVFYQRMRLDPAMRATFSEAHEFGIQALEAEAINRAVTGTPEPVFYLGKKVATVYKKSDRLLEFMLKARRPKVYRESVIIPVPVGDQAAAMVSSPAQVEAELRAFFGEDVDVVDTIDAEPAAAEPAAGEGEEAPGT